MKISHFEEERIYVVSNHAVARNPIFVSKDMQIFFKGKMHKYLEPLAEVISFNLAKHEFQIMLKLRTRVDFIRFYKSRSRYEEGEIIPESTYIFSRAMSNLQVSLVKKFNYIFKRDGALMASRFSREEVIGPEELVKWVERMNKGTRIHSYNGIWVNKVMDSQTGMTTRDLFKVDFEKKMYELSIKLYGNHVGQINANDKKLQITPISFHYRHFMKALCKYQL